MLLPRKIYKLDKLDQVLRARLLAVRRQGKRQRV
jgi:hypothetical protein